MSQRRALRRAAERPLRRHELRERKRTHRLAPQRCALYVPALTSYVACLESDRIAFTDVTALALILCEEHASQAALAFREA